LAFTVLTSERDSLGGCETEGILAYMGLKSFKSTPTRRRRPLRVYSHDG
jgi:hypothetical protein